MNTTIKSQFKIGLIILLIAIIVGLCREGFAQKDNRIAESNRRVRELSSQAYSPYLTEFNQMDLNFVNPRVQSFIADRLNLSMIENSSSMDSIGDHWALTEVYHKNFRTATEPEYKMSVIYKLKTEGNKFIIQSCTINGYYRFVISFFIEFWHTALNFENVKKEEVVINYWITDRAALSVYLADKKASIEIIKN